MSAVLQRWAPSNANIAHQLLLVFCRPNQLHFTQLIAVTFTTVWPVDRTSQQGVKNHKGGTFFKYNIECMQQPLRKKSLTACKLYSHLSRPRRLYRYERLIGRTPSFAILQLGQGKKQEIAYFANR